MYRQQRNIQSGVGDSLNATLHEKEMKAIHSCGEPRYRQGLSVSEHGYHDREVILEDNTECVPHTSLRVLLPLGPEGLTSLYSDGTYANGHLRNSPVCWTLPTHACLLESEKGES
jgi:hypothetical protein